MLMVSLLCEGFSNEGFSPSSSLVLVKFYEKLTLKLPCLFKNVFALLL